VRGSAHIYIVDSRSHVTVFGTGCIASKQLLHRAPSTEFICHAANAPWRAHHSHKRFTLFIGCFSVLDRMAVGLSSIALVVIEH
jgi:hypothetical protein